MADASRVLQNMLAADADPDIKFCLMRVERLAIEAAIRAIQSQQDGAQGGEAVAWCRENLGRIVRDEWMDWAREQPNPKPSWLTPWPLLTEPEREVDRRIGERIAKCVHVTFASRPAIAPQATPAAVDDAAVDRFWDEYIRQGQGGGALMYRDVKRLLTAAFAPQSAEVKP